MKRPDQNQKGIALMIVLWVLVLLIALATEFAFSMKMEVNTTRNFKEDVESYHFAKAGLAMAMAEILKPADFHSIHPDNGWIAGNSAGGPSAEENAQNPVQIKPGPESTEEEGLPAYEIIERDDIEFEGGTITYSITDENGKIPINTVQRGTLIKALGFIGLEIGEKRDIIADSILDWIDEDSNHRINGAENEYYKKQDPPYKAKNGKIETINELLNVRGITEELLFGSKKEDDEEESVGLANLFTTYNVKNINPNTASPEVLSILFDESQVQDILGKREADGYYNKSVSSHFRIKSTGKVTGSRTSHTLVTVIEKTGKADDPVLLTHYWNDNYIDL